MVRMVSPYIQDFNPQSVNIAILGATLADSIKNSTIEYTALIEKARAVIQEKVCKTNIKNSKKHELITALVNNVEQNAESNHITIANKANVSVQALIQKRVVQSNPFDCVIL